MYLNIIQLAESFGVEESAVEGWVANDGLPCVQDRGRMLFDRAQVTQWAAERGLAAKAGFLAPPRVAAGPACALGRLLSAGGIWRDIAASELLEVLERIVATLPGATPEVRRMLGQRLRAPGGVTWAPVGGGFALPHLRSSVTLGRDAGLAAILLLRDALPFQEAQPDDVAVTRLIFFIAPSPRAHLEILARLSGALTRGNLRPLLLGAASDAEIHASVNATDDHPAKREGGK
jgi:PTS system nitrogen regulatory IIA component